MTLFKALLALVVLRIPQSFSEFVPLNPQSQSPTAIRAIEATDSNGGPYCQRSLAGAINDFSFKLSKQLKGSGNVFISPLSISVALAMTYLGARGSTAKQMEQVLEFKNHNLKDSEINEGFRQVLAALASGNEDYKLLLANGMFLQKDYFANGNYVTDLKTYYRAVVQYMYDGVTAQKEINGWVSERTMGKIPSLFDHPLESVPPMMLLSAVYFKGTWKTQFNKNLTHEEPFRKSDGTVKKVNMMFVRRKKFSFLDDDLTQHKFLELPYKGHNIAMLLALPRDPTAPADLQMTSELLCRINSSLSLAKLREFKLPKFKIQYGVQLREPLSSMGMRDLFSSGTANLTGIRRQNDIFVDSVIHKAIIEVNEEGSEAAAVTAMAMGRSAERVSPDFVADHPFLVYIVDKRNGLVLFYARVTDPEY